MDNKNLMPQQVQPVNRITTGQLPDVLPDMLAELSEEALYGDSPSSASVLPLGGAMRGLCYCSYVPGEDAE